MGKLSREKGKRGERAFVKLLKFFGFSKSYRSQQFSGKCPAGSADVITPELPAIHWEVKNVERLNLWDAITQALIDRPAGKIPAVAHTKNNHGWLVTLPAEDFLNILRRSDLVEVQQLKDFSLLAETVCDTRRPHEFQLDAGKETEIK
jgi:hypothetical protein